VKAPAAAVQTACDLYNEAAKAHGWTVCATLTPPRAKRLEGRLRDIGGIEAFKRALSAVPRDTFLSGQVPPKDGRAPFRLDIDVLLQTDGKLGDVLAKLVDKAADSVAPRADAAPGDDWKQLIKAHYVGGVWPTQILGPRPGERGCLVPLAVQRELNLNHGSTGGPH